MSFYDNRCYYLNKKYLSIIGQWMYQSRLEGNVMLAIAILFSCSMPALQVWALITEMTDLGIFMEIASTLILNNIAFLKLINYIYNKRKMKQLLDDIVLTWQRMQTSPDIQILRASAEQSNVLILRYSITMYALLILYIGPPVACSAIYSILPMNKTSNVKFLYRVDNVIDVDKYFYWLMLDAAISGFYIMHISLAIDCFFVTCIQYICAFFDIMRHNMERIQGSDLVVLEPEIKDDEAYHIIINSIKFHKHALKFSELLSSAYAMSYLFLLANITVALSFSVAQLVMVDVKLDGIVKIISAILGQFLHLCYLSLVSQKLIDYSSGLHEVIYNCNWYTTSLRSRRLLNFMLRRTTKPCEIKAGKIYVMSMENFSSVLKASMSYFTMLTSLQ